MTGSATRSAANDDRIAIVGMSCRLPKVSDVSALWRLLAEGSDAVGPVRDDVKLVRPEVADLQFAGLLDEIDAFDAGFFNISPYEAIGMDPQQRLMLELCWTALEHGGIVPESIAGSRTGVFVGAMRDEYGEVLGRDDVGKVARHAMAGTSRAVIANRVSHYLDAKGPSLCMDAGQASSLVALHFARQSLLLREVDLALVGGVNLMVGAQSAKHSVDFGGYPNTGDAIHSTIGRTGTYEARVVSSSSSSDSPTR